MSSPESLDTVLIVDDEESVRRTFREWLESANLGCRILTAEDAESALVQANQHAIDLAILDWNLGAGNDGLRLLEDLSLFHPDVVAILITGYAHQATPLHAMRMGVRDYLDKNQDLDRETFLAAVRRQLLRIRPAKRERQLHRNLAAFREAVEKVLPLVQTAAALQDPVPLPEAIRGLLRFLLRATQAKDGVLLVRSHDADREPAEIYRAYDSTGSQLDRNLVPFARSVAGAVVAMQEPFRMHGDDLAGDGAVTLQPFERGRQSLLAAPINVAPGVQVILELFDKKDGFTEHDQRLVAAATDLGSELLRQALAERLTHQVLFDAVQAALGASNNISQTLQTSPPPPAVMEQLRESLRTVGGTTQEAEATLQLAEAIRVLTLKQGPEVLRYCTRMVEELGELLDKLTGTGEARP